MFLANFVNLLFSVLYFAILVRILLSWIPMSQDHPVVRLLNQITEPILAPARRIIPPMGGVDFSPMVVLVVLYVGQRLLVSILR